jgi:cysteinyl-tRNA synthetase
LKNFFLEKMMSDEEIENFTINTNTPYADINELRDKFMAALKDDLNTPLCLTCMMALCKIIFKATEMEKKQYGAMMVEALGKMLGIFEKDPDEYFKGNN